MKFSILHTSARPDKWYEVRQAWIENADNYKQVEYVLVCDKRWGFDQLPSLPERDTAVWNTGRKCYVDGVNIAAQYATGDVLIVIADDQFPCEHWDTELAKVIENPMYAKEACWESNFVIEVNTGTTSEHERGIMVMPILSRVRYESKGYVFYPAYESMYADNDFCEMAKADNAKNFSDYGSCILDARHLTFPHKHPLMNPDLEWDEAYKAQNRGEAYAIGEAIFEQRRASNFADAPAQAVQKQTFACLLPGEQFSQAYLGAWTAIVTQLVQSFAVNIYFGHASNVYFARQGIWDSMKQVPTPDYILWIDDDQVLTVDNLKLLVRDLEENPQLDGVCGWAWCEANIYGNKPMLSCGIVNGAGKIEKMEYSDMMSRSEDLIPIAYSGFPAVVLRGSVLDKAPDRAFMPIMDNNLGMYGMSGEDTAFFIKCREAGMNFAVDRRVKVPHLKLRCAEPTEITSMEGVPVSK